MLDCSHCGKLPLLSFQPPSISTDVVMGLGPKPHLSLQSLFSRGMEGVWKTSHSDPLQGWELEWSSQSHTVGCCEAQQCW